VRKSLLGINFSLEQLEDRHKLLHRAPISAAFNEALLNLSNLPGQIPEAFLLRLGNGTAISNQKAFPRGLFSTNVSR